MTCSMQTVNEPLVAVFGDDAAIDEIRDFESGVDSLQLDASGFADLSVGVLESGVAVSVIEGVYDGSDAGENLNFSAGLDAFIYSRADNTLYYDGNGTAEGYYAVATLDEPAAGDLAVVQV